MELTKTQITNIQKEAQNHFKKVHPEWICTIEGPYLVIQLNWMDVTYFNGKGVSHEARIYRYMVEILSDGTFKTMDVTADNEKAIGLDGVSLSASSFAGKQFIYHADARLGTDNQTGEKGIITYKFNNNEIKKPVMEYLEHLGLKYKSANSPREQFNALDGRIKLALGLLFGFTGLVFLIVLIILSVSSGMEVAQTVNGVTSVTTVDEADLVLLTVFTIIPIALITSSIALLVSYKRYNTKRGET